MADYCKLCERKLGFFASKYLVNNENICEDCYYAHKKVKDCILDLDIEAFETNLDEFKNKFSEKDNLEIFVVHLNRIRDSKLLEIEKQKEENLEREKKQKEDDEKTQQEINERIGPFYNQDLVYTIDGVRGRHIDVYKDKVVLTTKVTFGSLISHNATDGEKTIYYSDCIGIQFKQSKLAIGYLQLETASSSGNNKSDNFFNENSFTFDTSVVSNEKMVEVSDYIKSRIDAIKKGKDSSATVANNAVSNADELLKFKQLLDMGVITQEEFDAKKKQLLGL